MNIQLLNGKCVLSKCIPYPPNYPGAFAVGIDVTLGDQLSFLGRRPFWTQWKNKNLSFLLPEPMQFADLHAWPSLSKDSAAQYPVYLEGRDLGLNGGGILVQILFADTDPVYTSKHSHHQTIETFYPLYGESEFWTEDHGWQALDWATQVNPGCSHQLRVQNGFVMNFIAMHGNYSVRGDDCMKDHIFPE